jgi:RimJ/RimL family protein N-acetyltransferase
VEIVLDKCTLRDWRKGDESSLVRHANNPNVARDLADVFPHPYTLDDAFAWVARHAGIEPPTQFAIEIDASAVGGIGLIIGSGLHSRSAEIGYWLGEDYWGRGIMSGVVRAVTHYAFETFDLAHVFAGTFERAAGSRRVLEKAGFILEGRLRQHVTKNGETMDDFIYGIVR